MDTALLARPAAEQAAAAPTAPRVDLYLPIHKALRAFMADTLQRLGALDAADADDLRSVLGQLDRLLALLTSHLEHENAFAHPALEARRPGSSARVAAEHQEHRASIEALQAESAALRQAPAADRALRLYRHFALFMAENFEHMHYEETVHNATLWAHYDDAELMALHDELLATIPPDEMALVLRWMAPALDPAMRAGLLAELQTKLPPEPFRAMLDIVRSTLDDKRWAQLARALGLPPVPGLVTV